MSDETPTHSTSCTTGPPDMLDFLLRFKRLPQLSDDPPPWTYKGWLVPYLMFLHSVCPAVGNRWGYHLRTLDTGKLLDEPIPQITFGPADEKVFTLLHQ